MSLTEINTEIDEAAFDAVVARFKLTSVQASLLCEIISDNLERIITSRALELIRINPPTTLPQAKWLEELIHEINEHDVSPLELEVIPNPTSMILAYIAVAYLAIEL